MATVSIFVPAFNCEKYIASTIESVLSQSFIDWTMLIIDDCSTDRTFEICQEFAQSDNRISVIKNETNLGMMRNWQKGVLLTKGEFFIKLDGDDQWHPEMLSSCIYVMHKKSDVGMVVTRYAEMDSAGNVDFRSANCFPEILKDQPFSTDILVKRGVHGIFADNILQQGIGLIRRSCLDKVGNFTLLDSGDTEMWFRIGAHSKIYLLDKILYYYRRSMQSSSVTFNREGKGPKNLFEARRAIFEYYYQYQLLTKNQYQSFIHENEFVYLIQRANQSSFPGKVFRREFWEAMFRYPKLSLLFYMKRLREHLQHWHG